MRLVSWLMAGLLLGSAVRVSAAGAATRLTPEGLEFFEKKIRPALVQHCYECHAGDKRQGGLQLDTRANVLKGGTKGPVVDPGHPASSRLIQVLRYQGATKMPPAGKLPDPLIADFEKWVQLGAPDPREQVAKSGAALAWEAVVAERKKWWSLQPVRKPRLPAVKNPGWSSQPIDRLILAQLEKAGLRPSAPADRRTLIRRATLVLTGLPPTPEEVEAFVSDRVPRAYERLVDRLLARPQFGERWARHWMDVTRFGETHGYEWNYEVRDAWRYRDYLIRAFNEDVPYDQLVREHLAGDLLPQARWNRAEQINESLIGTAFFRFGEAGHDNFREIGYDTIDNQIDTLSKAFQAATVSCARCHEHKLDAVSQRDYYALFGILISSRPVVLTLDAADLNRPIEDRLRELKTSLRDELGALWLREAAEAGRYLLAAQAARTSSPDAGTRAQGLRAEVVQKWKVALEAKNPGLEDPAFVWNALVTAPPGQLAEAWSELSTRYAREAKERAAFNEQNYQPFGDFARAELSGWRADGVGLRPGASPGGEFAVALEGELAVTGIYPAGLYTHTLSERLNGTLVSPDLPADRQFIHLQVVGGKQAMLRMVPDFRHLSDFNRELKLDRPGWMTMGRQANQYDDRVFFELVTKLDNQRFPERGAQQAKKNLEDQRSFFGITRAYVSNRGEAPREEVDHVQGLLAGTPPSHLEDVAARFAPLATGAVEAWRAGRATEHDVRWLDWLLRNGLMSNTTGASARVAELVHQYRETEKQLTPPRVVAGMADLDRGADFPVLVRGDFKNLGEMVPRRFLEVLATPNLRAERGSGRRELAEEIASVRNPLTARVMVNRVWHWLFGTGIVRTVDDFGHMGEPPSHPELLDDLAARFVVDGWSVKRLVRTVMLTETFQQAAVRTPPAVQKDPENRLLSYYPARRLEAEAIRDSLLTVSGGLDSQLYGSSIDPYREKPSPDRKLYAGPLDGHGRRSLYTKITLMEAPKFLSVFNLPEAKAAQGRRDVTNVPAQALALLNDPFVLQQAERWARRLLEPGDANANARLDRMFRIALGRPPLPAEVDQFGQLLDELLTLHKVPAAERLTSLPVWKDVVHAVFNLKEFSYLP